MTEEVRRSAAKLIKGARRLLIEGGQNLFGGWSVADTALTVILNHSALHGDELSVSLVE